jgi:hypothetical protein
VTFSRFESLIFQLATPIGCGYYRTEASESGTRTYTVVLHGASPSTIDRPALDAHGARNFRHNPARATVSFDLDVEPPLRERVENDPTVKRVVEVLQGEIEEVRDTTGELE